MFHLQFVTNSLNTFIMYRVILSLFLIAFAPALCSTLKRGEADSSTAVSLEATEVTKNITDLENNAVVQNPKCLFNPNERSDILKCSSNSSNDEDLTQESSDVPSLPSEQVLLPVAAVPSEYMQPAIAVTNSWARAPYEVNPANIMESLGLTMGHYGGVLYPHAHPKLYPSLYPSYPANSLSPMHSTYIHGIIPTSEDSQRVDYDFDLLNAQNARFLPELSRPGRKLRSSEEDFLRELSHDAMMNNILPSMSIPFFRYASPVVNPVEYRPGPPIALFPHGVSSSFAQPILLTCSPKISRGIVGHNVYSDSYMRPPARAASTPAPYRKEKIGKKVNSHNDFIQSIGHKREWVSEFHQCPPGMMMGINLRCILRRRASISNETLWENYDSEIIL